MLRKSARPVHSVAIVLTGAVLLVGCGTSGTTRTSSGASTLPPGQVPTTVAVTNGGTTASSTAKAATTTAKPSTSQDRASADSGTTEGDKVADGTYWGYLVESTKVGSQQAVKWDEVRFLTGKEAETEAKRQGKPVPDNDYIIVNANPGLKTTRVAADAKITKIQGEPNNQVDTPLSGVVGSKSTLYVLTVKMVDGVSVITNIKQQYRP